MTAEAQASANVVPALFEWLPWAGSSVQQTDHVSSKPTSAVSSVAIGESEWREAYYSHAGGFDQQWVEAGAPRWLDAMTGDASALDSESFCAEELFGRNTCIEVGEARLRAALPELRRALGSSAAAVDQFNHKKGAPALVA